MLPKSRPYVAAVILGPSRFEGDVVRWVDLTNGGGRVEIFSGGTWAPTTTVNPGEVGARPPLSASEIAALGCGPAAAPGALAASMTS